MGRGRAVRRGLAIGAALFTVLAAAGPGRADELAGTRQRLAEIERRIQETAATVEEKRHREEELKADMATLEYEQRRLEESIGRHQVTLNQLGGKVADEERRAAKLKAAVEKSAEQVRRRLVALYKSGDGGMLRVLFSATSPARLAEDYDFFARIIGHDRQLIATYRGQLQQQEVSLHRLADLRQQEEKALAASRNERRTLKAAGALKTRLLAEMQSDRQKLDRQLGELRERAQRLAALVKKLESSKGAAYSGKPGFFAQQQGLLRWPLEGPVNVAFGTTRHPELGTLHDSQGIEIGCKPGQKVHAVWAGRVIFANWFKGYGNLLIINHGNSYYSLYAQAASLAKHVGDQVAPGEVVAETGYEGTHRLYFEIRHSDTPLDPEAWLAPRNKH
jgi:murein hydrolase activator